MQHNSITGVLLVQRLDLLVNSLFLSCDEIGWNVFYALMHQLNEKVNDNFWISLKGCKHIQREYNTTFLNISIP